MRWTESVQLMADKGCDDFVEVGSGKVLCGLVKRIAKGANAANVGEPADVEAFSKA